VMALVEPWMELAVCMAFPELPWLADADRVTAAQLVGMSGACRSCGVFERCAAFVEREDICGGFWAGEFREPVEDLGQAEGHVCRPVDVGGAA
jgi:hypothetical protein